MNKKKILLAVILLLVVALIAVAVVLLQPGKNGAGNATDTSKGQSSSNGKTDNYMDAVEGVEDSIFDDDNPPQNDTSSDQQAGNKDQQDQDQDDDADKPGPPSGNTTTPNPGTVTTPPVTDDTPDQNEDMTYEEFISMTPTKQREYQATFDDVEAFFDWYNAAKEQYEKEHPSIEVDGPIDMEQIAGGNS